MSLFGTALSPQTCNKLPKRFVTQCLEERPSFGTTKRLDQLWMAKIAAERCTQTSRSLPNWTGSASTCTTWTDLCKAGFRLMCKFSTISISSPISPLISLSFLSPVHSAPTSTTIPTARTSATRRATMPCAHKMHKTSTLGPQLTVAWRRWRHGTGEGVRRAMGRGGRRRTRAAWMKSEPRTNPRHVPHGRRSASSSKESRVVELH
mmetsp:Transcript_13418/g.28940  ORF Transcript_13418/g.28940 Transcript_13418/m.28940 type:complete len:206 (-) Transcript_13418:51-668(-)